MMKFRRAKIYLPKTSAGEMKALPLAETILRWYAWAGEMAKRFGIRPQRLSDASRIFLLRRDLTSVNRRINYWRINWQPIIRLYHRVSTLRGSFTDKHYSHYPMEGTVNIEVESRNNLDLHTPRLGSQEAPHPTLNVEIGWRGEVLKMPTSRWLFGNSRAGTLDDVVWRDMGYKIDPVTTRILNVPSRSLSGMTFRSHELTKLGDIIHRQNNLYFKKREIITRQFIEPRQRVEVRPGDRRGMINAHQVLRREETLRETDRKEPMTPVFHKNRISHEAERPDVRQVQLPTTPSNPPFGMTPPQMDLNQITDQVIRQLDRRMVIWRERTGRV